MNEMQIIISTTGDGKCLYEEAIDLRVLGQLEIRRGSHVEPTEAGGWTADMSPVKGPLLGPFQSRSAALQAEQKWLEQNWLFPQVTKEPLDD